MAKDHYKKKALRAAGHSSRWAGSYGGKRKPRRASKWAKAFVKYARKHVKVLSNPGAKECIVTAPHKFYQWRYKMGFARVRCQHFENMSNAKKPVWRHLKTYQMPKATANRQIQNLDALGWKLKVTY